jgi:hypothetical protein
MGGRASRRKGHDWEREVASRFREVFGHDKVRRGLQTRTGREVPDVDALCFWIECKRGKQTNPKAALRQAAAVATKGRIPLAICKDDRCAPTATLLLDDFLELVEEWWRLRDC